MLAEISDKMPTVGEMWVMMLCFSIPALVGIPDRRAALVVLVIATSFSAYLSWCYCYGDFFEPGMSAAIQGELGAGWIANSIASAWLPAIVALAVFCWHFKRRGVACNHRTGSRRYECSDG